MASRSLKPCTYPGCSQLTKGARCSKHEAQRQAQLAKEDVVVRGTAQDRGYDSEWRVLRAKVLESNPLCPCGSKATLVHHIHPVSVAPELRLDWNNLIALCASCHRKEHERIGVGIHK